MASDLISVIPAEVGIHEELMRQGRFPARRNPESPVPATQNWDLAQKRRLSVLPERTRGQVAVRILAKRRALARAGWARDRAAGAEHAAGGRVQR